MAKIVGFIHKIFVKVRQYATRLDLSVSLYSNIERTVRLTSSINKRAWLTNTFEESVVCFVSVNRIVRIDNEIQLVAEV